jgi:DNA mismatch repair protein MutL
VDEVPSSFSGTKTQSSGYNNTLVKQGMAEDLVNSSQVINQTSKNYQQLMTTPQPVNSASNSNAQATLMPGQWLQISNKNILLKVAQKFYLLETKALHRSVMSKLYADTMPVSQPLLMPISIIATAELLAKAKTLYQPLLENSVEIGWTPNRIILRKVPAGLRQFRWIEYLEDILTCSEIEALKVRKHMLTCMVSGEEISLIQIQDLWQQFVYSSDNLEHDIAQIGKPVHLQDWLNTNE